MRFFFSFKICLVFFLLSSHKRYEAKRIEIETWLARMEHRLEQMGKIATTADVLEAQQKEQKVSYTIISSVMIMTRPLACQKPI